MNLLELVNGANRERAARQAAIAILRDESASQEHKLKAILELVDDPTQIRLCSYLEPNSIAVCNGLLWIGPNVWAALMRRLEAR